MLIFGLLLHNAGLNSTKDRTYDKFLNNGNQGQQISYYLLSFCYMMIILNAYDDHHAVKNLSYHIPTCLPNDDYDFIVMDHHYELHRTQFSYGSLLKFFKSEFCTVEVSHV